MKTTPEQGFKLNSPQRTRGWQRRPLPEVAISEHSLKGGGRPGTAGIPVFGGQTQRGHPQLSPRPRDGSQTFRGSGGNWRAGHPDVVADATLARPSTQGSMRQLGLQGKASCKDVKLLPLEDWRPAAGVVALLDPEPAAEGSGDEYAAAADAETARAAKQVAEVERLAESIGRAGPNALLAARVLDALVRLLSKKRSQHRLVEGVAQQLKNFVFHSTVRGTGSSSSLLVPLSSQSVLENVVSVAESESLVAALCRPVANMQRVPYFDIAKRQLGRIQDAATRMSEYSTILTQTISVRFITSNTNPDATAKKQTRRVDFAAGESTEKRRGTFSLASTVPATGNQSYDSYLVWMFSFWKMFRKDSAKSRQHKDELVASNVYEIFLRAFRAWQVDTNDKKSILVRMNRHAHYLEKHLLAVAVKDLEDQQEDAVSELELSASFRKRMETRFAESKVIVQDLRERLERARPELVKATLSGLFNVVFADQLSKARLSRIPARRHIMTRELSVMLTTDEDGLHRLANMNVDKLLARWLNYHLLECKLMAHKVLDIVQHARSDAAGPLPDDWHLRDLDSFVERCKTVRALRRAVDFNTDLKDGLALAVLCAVLGEGSGPQSSSASPHSLSLLDIRDPERRAEVLCAAFRAMLPTRALQCLFQPSDILQGNGMILTIIIGTLFLHSSKLPSSVPEEQVWDYVNGASWSNQMAQKKASKAKKEEVASTYDATETSLARMAEEDEDVDEDATETYVKQVATTVEKAATTAAYDSLQDMTLLLHEGELASDLLSLAAPDFLLRWVNYKLGLEDGSRMECWDDVAQGRVLLQLLKNTAFDVMNLLPEGRLLLAKKGDATREDTFPESLATVALRCTDFVILTEDVVRNLRGHIDVVAAFVACLFLCRPNVSVGAQVGAGHRGASLYSQVSHIENAVRRSMQSRETPGSGFSELCVFLNEDHQKFSDAMSAVARARELHSAVEANVHSFVGAVLTLRSQGTSFALEVGTTEETIHARLMAPGLLEALVTAETRAEEDDAHEQAESLEDLVRKYAAMFKIIFKHYSISTLVHEDEDEKRNGSLQKPQDEEDREAKESAQRRSMLTSILADSRTATFKDVSPSDVILLRGFTHLAIDCKFHRLSLSLADVETIYMQVYSAEQTRDSLEEAQVRRDHRERGAGLTICGLAEALMLVGYRGSTLAADMPSAFSDLVDRNLWPYATFPRTDTFYQLAYDPGIYPVLHKYGEILRAVYQVYAEPTPTSRIPLLRKCKTVPKMPNTNQRRFLGSVFHKMGEKHFLSLETLECMLDNADIIDLRFSKATIVHILRSLAPVVDSDDEDEAGIPSFSMLTDGKPRKTITRSTVMGAGKKRGAKAAPYPGPDSEHGRGRPTADDLESKDISFMEFIDFLVVAVLWKEPNPFVPFLDRLELFVCSNLLWGLRLHWEPHQDSVGGELSKTLCTFLDTTPGMSSFAPSKVASASRQAKQEAKEAYQHLARQSSGKKEQSRKSMRRDMTANEPLSPSTEKGGEKESAWPSNREKNGKSDTNKSDPQSPKGAKAMKVDRQPV